MLRKPFMLQRKLDLDNKIVLVTGSTSGIGKEIARVLATFGARVGINSRNPAQVANTTTQIIKEGRKAFEAPFDVARYDEVKEGIRRIQKMYGSIDILVNNAGRNDHYGSLEDISEKVWQDVVDTFLTSAFFCTKEVLPQMKKKGWGRIINIGSDAAFIGIPQRTHYSAAKAGLIGLTRALAAEVGMEGITINTLAPGIIKTEGNAYLLEQSHNRKNRTTGDNLIGRIGKPEDVAYFALFLCTEQAEFITGQVFHVNGGKIM